MFAMLLLVFNIGIFNSCGTLFLNLCTTSIGIIPLGRENLWFSLYIWLVFTFDGVLIETTVMECGLNFILPFFLIIGCITGVEKLHKHLPIYRQKMPTCYTKACSYKIWPLYHCTNNLITVLDFYNYYFIPKYLLPIFTCRKPSPLGISASPPPPLSVLLHCSIFGLCFRLSENFVVMTLILAPALCKVVWGQVSFMLCYIFMHVMYIFIFFILYCLGELYILCILYYLISFLWFYYMYCDIFYTTPHNYHSSLDSLTLKTLHFMIPVISSKE